MQANIDKGFVELLNKRTGLSLTYKQFTDIYLERKEERDNDPVVQAKKARHRALEDAVNSMMYDE